MRWARTLDSSRLWDPASGWLDPKDATSSPSDGGRHGNATGWVSQSISKIFRAAYNTVLNMSIARFSGAGRRVFHMMCHTRFCDWNRVWYGCEGPPPDMHITYQSSAAFREWQ